MKKNIGFISLCISIAFFLFSLTQKCYCTDYSCADSLAVFISGPIGLLFGGAALTWIANPVLIFSWIFFKNQKMSMILSLIALIISTSFLLFPSIIENEAGHINPIISYKIGYWLWLISSFAMFLGNTYLFFLDRKNII